MPNEDGPIVLGVDWKFREHVVRTAADLATALGRHLVCAFVDPASYLTEWEPQGSVLTAQSLDPTTNDEAEFPSAAVHARLESLLGKPGETWSFRVLNGFVPRALSRLAASCGASMLVVGGGRAGPLERVDRALEGSVSTWLVRHQDRPVVVVPDHSRQPGSAARSHRA